MDAIVFTSNTGFTEKYARMLSAKTGLPVYSFKDSRKALKPGSEVVYMGWLLGGHIQGYDKARVRFKTSVVCAVGMGSLTDELPGQLKEGNGVDDAQLFYLQGGYDSTKLKGIYKFMMNTVARSQLPKLEAATDRTPEDDLMLDMMKNGRDMVSEAALEPVVELLSR